MDAAPDRTEILISRGFDGAEATQVAHLFWQAFEGKLGLTLGPERRALDSLAPVLYPEQALVARDGRGALLGVAGLKIGEVGMLGGGFAELARVYGWFGALWRSPLLALLERDPGPNVLFVDGIFVDQAARGLGVGSALLDAVKQMALDQGYRTVALEVVDTNTRAHALYQREGFEVVGQEAIGLLRHIFGFKSSLLMNWSAEVER